MSCFRRPVLLLCFTLLFAGWIRAQSAAAKKDKTQPVKELEQEFFAAIRAGEAAKVLAYIPERGVNVGSQAQHVSRQDIEEQFHAHRDLYCRLFDSSCINSSIDLGNSSHTCSDREMLTHSQKVRTASSEMTRNSVQQAVLVAEVKNDQCGGSHLIDFIFNLDADGWRLFSIP